MAGRIFDLSQSDVRLPAALLLDTSVVIPRFLPMLRRPGPMFDVSQARVGGLLVNMAAQSTVPLLAAGSFAELAHLVLRTRYTNDLPASPDPASGRPFPSWTWLYKARPALVLRYAADVERLRLAIEVAGIGVLQPADLGPIASARRFEEVLIRLIRRYRLDSADAAILMEARRAGIGSVVSEDPDWRRAARDFDVYTWP